MSLPQCDKRFKNLWFTLFTRYISFNLNVIQWFFLTEWNWELYWISTDPSQLLFSIALFAWTLITYYKGLNDKIVGLNDYIISIYITTAGWYLIMMNTTSMYIWSYKGLIPECFYFSCSMVILHFIWRHKMISSKLWNFSSTTVQIRVSPWRYLPFIHFLLVDSLIQ